MTYKNWHVVFALKSTYQTHTIFLVVLTLTTVICISYHSESLNLENNLFFFQDIIDVSVTPVSLFWKMFSPLFWSFISSSAGYVAFSTILTMLYTMIHLLIYNYNTRIIKSTFFCWKTIQKTYIQFWETCKIHYKNYSKIVVKISYG